MNNGCSNCYNSTASRPGKKEELYGLPTQFLVAARFICAQYASREEWLRHSRWPVGDADRHKARSLPVVFCGSHRVWQGGADGPNPRRNIEVGTGLYAGPRPPPAISLKRSNSYSKHICRTMQLYTLNSIFEHRPIMLNAKLSAVPLSPRIRLAQHWL
jgi:hypothetical protein